MLQHVAASNKKFIQERDRELAGIQRAMLNATGPLCTLHDQLEQGVTLQPQDLKLILQQTLCLLGSANTQLSTLRRKKILASINKSKIDLATQPLPNAKKWLFGDDFPSIASKEEELSRGLAKNLAPKLDKSKTTYGSRDSRYVTTSSNNSSTIPKNGKYQNFRQKQKFFGPPGSQQGSCETPSVHRTMEEHNFRPCGFRNCYRSKHSFSLCSFSKVTTGDKNSSGVIPTFRAGSPKLAGERGNMQSPVLRRRFLQSVICNPKKGRKHTSNYRPKSSKSLHRHTAFSNGELGYSKVSSQARSLHDQDRSQGRILFGSYSPSESKNSWDSCGKTKHSSSVLFRSVWTLHRLCLLASWNQ